MSDQVCTTCVTPDQAGRSLTGLWNTLSSLFANSVSHVTPTTKNASKLNKTTQKQKSNNSLPVFSFKPPSKTKFPIGTPFASSIFLPPPLSNTKLPIKLWPNHWESPYIYIPNPPFHTSHPPLIPPSQPFKISLPTQLHHYTSPKNILGSLKSLPRQISKFSTLQTNISPQKSIHTFSFNPTLIYPTPHFDTPYFVFWDGGWSTKVP